MTVSYLYYLAGGCQGMVLRLSVPTAVHAKVKKDGRHRPRPRGVMDTVCHEAVIVITGWRQVME